jgi:DNA-directed RNA polymerase subunit RPC12/RpoP
MARSAAQPVFSVVCPHCKKEFEAHALVAPDTGEPQGFKCPHCRLFVPLERADAAEPAS